MNKLIKLRSEMRAGHPTPLGFVYPEPILKKIVKEINDKIEAGQPIVGQVLNKKSLESEDNEITHKIVKAEYVNGRVVLLAELLDNVRAGVLAQLSDDITFVPKLVTRGNEIVEQVITITVKVVNSVGELVRVDIGVEE